MLDSIRDYDTSGVKHLSNYVPILDRDPEYAAKFLTKADLKKAYKLLLKVYEEIRKDRYDYKFLHDTIMDSKDNFLWFKTFFETIEGCLNISIKKRYRVPVEKMPNNEGNAPHVFQPFRLSKNYDCFCYYRTNIKGQNPINNYRIRYVVEDYDIKDFQDEQFPAWYILKNTTIYEQYNEKTNTRVRIDFRDGHFFYFLAGASDNWQMIPDVPVEMDHVVSALLFRHFD